MKLLQSTVQWRMGNQEKKAQLRTGAAVVAAVRSKAKVARGVESTNPFSGLASLRETVASDRSELFRKKLAACSTIYDFNTELHQPEKEAKRQTLLEIVEYVNNARNCFNDAVMHDVVSMVGANIFRSLPMKHRGLNSIYDPEDEEPVLENAWPHLQIVYELFLRFVVSNDVDAKIAKRFIDATFVLKILELFDSEDPRERDFLKTIMHRLYGKFMTLRSFIRKSIQHCFFKVIYESELHNGVGEMLEILGSIINGFAVPLKEEHKEFLIHALIPLHKVKSLITFHQQLAYCMTQYIEKDPRLAQHIVEALLKFWPVSVTSKQVLFLNELEETLELTQAPEFTKFKEPLFKRIANCIACPHFQVAERALFLWNNDYIVKLINNNRESSFPIVIGPLYHNSVQHWNIAVHGLAFNVLKLLMETDQSLYDECSQRNNAAFNENKVCIKERETKWKELELAFRINSSEIVGPTAKLSVP